MNEITLTLNSPITEEQWDAITDVDFEHTNEITFHTKHGKEVKFVKASAQQWIPCSNRMPEKPGKYLVTVKNGNVYAGTFDVISGKFHCAATAWMPLPEPYREEV